MANQVEAYLTGLASLAILISREGIALSLKPVANA